jgi:hypothetical protein
MKGSPVRVRASALRNVLQSPAIQRGRLGTERAFRGWGQRRGQHGQDQESPGSQRVRPCCGSGDRSPCSLTALACRVRLRRPMCSRTLGCITAKPPGGSRLQPSCPPCDTGGQTPLDCVSPRRRKTPLLPSKDEQRNSSRKRPTGHECPKLRKLSPHQPQLALPARRPPLKRIAVHLQHMHRPTSPRR